MIRRLLGACIGVVVVAAWACGGSDGPDTPPPTGDGNVVNPPPNRPETDAGTDAGTGGDTDAGTDAGTGGGTGGDTDAGTDAGTDGGTNGGTDGGTDGGTGGTDGGTTDPQPVPGPWPTDAVVDYSAKYGIPSVRSVSVDAAHNIWLLDGDRIGVLRADTKKIVWTGSPIGQAAGGFGETAAAMGSTVICGGTGGRAYVGYATYDMRPDPEFPGLHTNYLVSPGQVCEKDNPNSCYPYSHRRLQEYKRGDVDVVRLDPNGNITLEERLHQSIRNTKDGSGNPVVQTGPRELDDVKNLGIRNSNDHHFDEDRSVLSCVRVMRGRDQNDVYIGTNHGVTRIRGLQYNSHRHPVWFTDNGSQMAGYTYGLGIAQDGDVLIANDWTFGMVTPTPRLGDWDNTSDTVNAMKVKSSYLPEVNSLSEFDYWRGFQQTKDGAYYLGSRSHGLWQLTITRASNQAQKGTRIEGSTPEQQAALKSINALAATDDGSLFIGSDADGLWRMTPQKTLEKVPGVKGNRVLSLTYDPSVSPAMLLVHTSSGLTVIRGY